jgi:hypothetical protein
LKRQNVWDYHSTNTAMIAIILPSVEGREKDLNPCSLGEDSFLSYE